MSEVLIHEPSGGTQRIRDAGPGHAPVPAANPEPFRADPAAGGPGGSDGHDQPHLHDYLRVLAKRRWPALTLLLLVVLPTAIYSFTATPIYSARVQILIEKEESNVVAFKETIEQNQITDDYYQTQYRILQSRALARRTLDRLGLWHHPQFSDAAGQPGVAAAALTAVAGQSTPTAHRADTVAPDETQ